MFVVLEEGKKVLKEDIIGIFDIDDKVTPKITQEFLKKAEKNKEITLAGYELPKSFIVTKNPKEKIIFTHLSAKTIASRAEIQIFSIGK